MQIWEQVLKTNPGHHDTLFALVTSLRDAGEFTQALFYAQHLARQMPDNEQIKQLLAELRMRSAQP